MLTPNRRGRHADQHRLRPGPHHLGPADDLCHALLDPHHLPRQANHLRLGFPHQRRIPRRPGYRGLRRLVDVGLPGAGVPGSHRLGPVHPRTCARLVGYHRRDFVHPSQAPHDRCRTCCVLHRQHSLHFPRKLHA